MYFLLFCSPSLFIVLDMVSSSWAHCKDLANSSITNVHGLLAASNAYLSTSKISFHFEMPLTLFI